MEQEKRYYWLKLKDDFFSSKYIKYLRSQDDGDKMLCVYLELQLKSLKTIGVIRYDKLMPSCAEEIAFDLGEPVDIVNRTIYILKQLNLVEIMDDGGLYLSAVKEVTGSETAAAERKRKQRSKATLEPGENPFEAFRKV